MAGVGGTVMQKLITDIIVRQLGGTRAEVPLEALNDAFVIDDIVLKTSGFIQKEGARRDHFLPRRGVGNRCWRKQDNTSTNRRSHTSNLLDIEGRIYEPCSSRQSSLISFGVIHE